MKERRKITLIIKLVLADKSKKIKEISLGLITMIKCFKI